MSQGSVTQQDSFVPYSMAHMPVPVAMSSTCVGSLTGAWPSLPPLTRR